MAGTIHERREETRTETPVSMESGLDGRNNGVLAHGAGPEGHSLNGVRPRWPEQCLSRSVWEAHVKVSQWSPA